MSIKYNEYATCTWCGYKKYCKLENRKWVCKSCDQLHQGETKK